MGILLSSRNCWMCWIITRTRRALFARPTMLEWEKFHFSVIRVCNFESTGGSRVRRTRRFSLSDKTEFIEYTNTFKQLMRVARVPKEISKNSTQRGKQLLAFAESRSTISRNEKFPGGGGFIGPLGSKMFLYNGEIWCFTRSCRLG